ncbi:PAS domain S-box protein [Sphingomonas sp. R86521]|uniref:PAS domain S-box protein n=1 Tax=Sphingomonas sp. R86521 TaxID=3093860 RepID=UPI0036D29627
MPNAGHVLIGTDGKLLDVDAAFCDIMRCDPDGVRGRSVMDLTAPADRQECAKAIETLLETQRPFAIVKRLIRCDGSLVWVRNSVSITMDGSRAAMVVGTIEPVAEQDAVGNPAILLDVARLLIRGRRDRELVCDRSLFSDPGWDAVLAAYVAEAEGRAVNIVTLATRLGHAPATIDRWVRALIQHNVLELEYRNPRAEAPKAFRLTTETHRKLESYLGNIRPRYRELAMHDD